MILALLIILLVLALFGGIVIHPLLFIVALLAIFAIAASYRGRGVP